jgi:hypothetical protein
VLTLEEQSHEYGLSVSELTGFRYGESWLMPVRLPWEQKTCTPSVRW